LFIIILVLGRVTPLQSTTQWNMPHVQYKPKTQDTKTVNTHILMIIHQGILDFNKDIKVNEHDFNFGKCLYSSCA
jgi:hypothetical protein